MGLNREMKGVNREIKCQIRVKRATSSNLESKKLFISEKNVRTVKKRIFQSVLHSYLILSIKFPITYLDLSITFVMFIISFKLFNHFRHLYNQFQII